jgi:hypothetical protein
LISSVVRRSAWASVAEKARMEACFSIIIGFMFFGIVQKPVSRSFGCLLDPESSFRRMANQYLLRQVVFLSRVELELFISTGFVSDTALPE